MIPLLPFSIPTRSAFTLAKEQYAYPDQPNSVPCLKTPPEYADELLSFFALHRIATPYHLMRAFPRFYRYHNRVMRHLDWLVTAGFLHKHEFNGRFRSYIYNIAASGYERCRDIVGIDLRRIPYNFEEPKGKQALHELQITETAVSIYEFIRSNQRQDIRGVALLEEGRFMLCSEPAFSQLVPDYWYMVRDGNGLMIRFVEMICGEESGTRIRKMFQEYDGWAQLTEVQTFLVDLYRKHGATEPQPEFELHSIVHSRNWNHTDAYKERLTLQQTFDVSPEMQGRVWTTTNDSLSNALDEGRGINDAMWHRGMNLLGDIRKNFLQHGHGRSCPNQFPDRWYTISSRLRGGFETLSKRPFEQEQRQFLTVTAMHLLRCILQTTSPYIQH